jgi:hypothetical protein
LQISHNAFVFCFHSLPLTTNLDPYTPSNSNKFEEESFLLTEPSQKAPFESFGDEWLFRVARGEWGRRLRVRSTEIPLLTCNQVSDKMVA